MSEFEKWEQEHCVFALNSWHRKMLLTVWNAALGAAAKAIEDAGPKNRPESLITDGFAQVVRALKESANE